jgi:hypothetical protein
VSESLPCPICMNKTLFRVWRDRWSCGWSRANDTERDSCSFGCTTAALVNDDGSFTDKGQRMARAMDEAMLRHTLSQV